jgi:hypothetical protein
LENEVHGKNVWPGLRSAVGSTVLLLLLLLVSSEENEVADAAEVLDPDRWVFRSDGRTDEMVSAMAEVLPLLLLVAAAGEELDESKLACAIGRRLRKVLVGVDDCKGDIFLFSSFLGTDCWREVFCTRWALVFRFREESRNFLGRMG